VNHAAGIHVTGGVEVTDNYVYDIGPAASSSNGIVVVDNPDGLVRGNRVRRLIGFSGAVRAGIDVSGSPGLLVADNWTRDTTTGVACDTSETFVVDHDSSDAVAVSGCGDSPPGRTDRRRTAGPPSPASRTCTGYIDSLPAVVYGEGNWCLRADLTVPISSGAAITTGSIKTIDCRGHRISNLGAGPDTQAIGIQMDNLRDHARIRGCVLQGFRQGIVTTNRAESPIVIDDTRIEGATFRGIWVGSAIVRRVELRNIGTGGARADGIFIDGNGFVEDTTIDGILVGDADGTPDRGIGIRAPHVVNSRVRNVRVPVTATGFGIVQTDSAWDPAGNVVIDADVPLRCDGDACDLEDNEILP
jgi:hypothetical protein